MASCPLDLNLGDFTPCWSLNCVVRRFTSPGATAGWSALRAFYCRVLVQSQVPRRAVRRFTTARCDSGLTSASALPALGFLGPCEV